MTTWPEPSLRHVARLTDHTGVCEHAVLAAPRRDLGYCTDDAGRALAVAARLPRDPDAQRVAAVALRFLRRAHLGSGGFRLRLRPVGGWSGEQSDDAAGRALMGLGTAVARAPWPEVQHGAAELFDDAAPFDSPYRRAMAYAALGAVEVAAAIPGHSGAMSLIDRAERRVAAPPVDGAWPWPEPRLTYANALLPEAALAIAVTTGADDAANRALALLEWLVQEETMGSRFSFTPVGGRGPSDDKPGFDQQPIEAWAMADACARAYSVTGEQRWVATLERAAVWFLGGNDVGVAVFDAETGGGYDGLEPGGVNRNEGAESSLAFVATMLQVRTAEQDAQAARSSVASASRSRR
jgi:hypothetical protein